MGTALGGVGHAEQAQRPVVGDALRARTGQQLVQDRQRVAGRTAAGADHQREDLLGHRNALASADALQQAPHHRRRQQPERVVMGARADGGEHLLRLGRREDEDEVLRRLLDDLEQRIEARRRDHVRLVDDEDAVAALGRGVERAVAEVAGVVDAAVARGVEFHNVEVARSTRSERHARRARAARRRRRSLDAVQRTREDAGRRRLTATAGPGEQIGMVDAAGIECSAQGRGDVLLADDFGEGCRTIGAIESHGSQTTGEL